jgi:hypothetical protein
MFNDDDAYTYPPVEAPILTEAALVDRLEAQCGGEWWEDSRHGPDGYELAIYTAQPSDPAHVLSLLSYLWAGPMRGESIGDQTPEVLIEGHLFVFSVDTTKSGRDDVPWAWDDHKHWLVEGTPVRKTDKAGPSTKGTRAVEGVGPVLMAWR